MRFVCIAVAGMVLGSCTGEGPTCCTIGGTVSGLTGSGLVLRLNGTGDLPVPANGTFTFPERVSPGTAYEVTVLTQPVSPSQYCMLISGKGVASTDVTRVRVACYEPLPCARPTGNCQGPPFFCCPDPGGMPPAPPPWVLDACGSMKAAWQSIGHGVQYQCYYDPLSNDLVAHLENFYYDDFTCLEGPAEGYYAGPLCFFVSQP